MTETKPHPKNQLPPQRWPRWKILLCVGAGALIAGGLAAQLFGSDEVTPLQGGGPPPMGSSLTEGQPGSANAESNPWSSGMLTMGFSFFVGFAVGTAVRAFLKTALLFAGLVFLVMLVGQHFGLIDVKMQSLQQLWNDFVARVQQDFGAFKTIVTGRLPQAGLGALGLFAGLKRR